MTTDDARDDRSFEEVRALLAQWAAANAEAATASHQLYVRLQADDPGQSLTQIEGRPLDDPPPGPPFVAVDTIPPAELVASLSTLAAYALAGLLQAHRRSPQSAREIDKVLRTEFAKIFRTIVAEASEAARQIAEREREAGA